MRRTPLALLVILSTAALAACGDDGGSSPDGRALAAAFGEAAAEAYEAEDMDREEDFNRGLTIDEGCLVIDQELAEAMLQAAYASPGDDEADDEVEVSGGFIHGVPGESEMATCSLQHGDRRMGATFGTTLRNVEQQEAAARRGPLPEAERVEIDVDGLPSDEVLVLVDEEGEFVSASWVGDGFYVSLNAPLDDTEPDQVARALGIAVEELADELDD